MDILSRSGDVKGWILGSFSGIPLFVGIILLLVETTIAGKIIGGILVSYFFLYCFITGLLYKYNISEHWNPFLGFLITCISLIPAVAGAFFYNPTKDKDGNDVPATISNKIAGGSLMSVSLLLIGCFVYFIHKSYDNEQSKSSDINYTDVSGFRR